MTLRPGDVGYCPQCDDLTCEVHCVDCWHAIDEHCEDCQECDCTCDDKRPDDIDDTEDEEDDE